LAGQGGAALLGASLGMLLTRTMPPAALASWGWRIPFLIGLLIVPAGIYFRRRLLDPAVVVRAGDRAEGMLVELWREHGTTTALATLMMLWRTVPVYAIVFYMPSYLTRVVHLPAIIGFRSSALSALLLVVVSPLSGLLADRLPRRKPLVLVTSGLTALLVYPAFLLITRTHGAWPVLLGVGLITALIALGTSANTLFVLEALPARVRASGLAISYALGVALFGGTAQFGQMDGRPDVRGLVHRAVVRGELLRRRSVQGAARRRLNQAFSHRCPQARRCVNHAAASRRR
jgi:MHS family proline/betaine transporter-like MFS transporter